MRPVPIVEKEQASVARDMEGLLLSMEPVVFASVRGVPGQPRSFKITIGATTSPDTTEALARVCLIEQIGAGARLEILAIQGRGKTEQEKARAITPSQQEALLSRVWG